MMKKMILLAMLACLFPLSGAPPEKQNADLQEDGEFAWNYIPESNARSGVLMPFPVETLDVGEALRIDFQLRPLPSAGTERNELIFGAVRRNGSRSSGFCVISPMTPGKKEYRLAFKKTSALFQTGGPLFVWLAKRHAVPGFAENEDTPIQFTIERSPKAQFKLSLEINGRNILDDTVENADFEPLFDHFFIGTRSGVTPFRLARVKWAKINERPENVLLRAEKKRLEAQRTQEMAAVFATIRENLRQLHLRESADAGDDPDTARILAEVQPDGSCAKVDYRNPAQARLHIQTFSQLAQAYNRQESKFYRSAAVKETFFRMAAFWFRAAPPAGTNWHTLAIAWPQLWSPGAVLMYAELKSEQPELLRKLAEALTGSRNRIMRDSSANAAPEALMLLTAAALSDDLELYDFTCNALEKRVFTYAHQQKSGELGGCPEGIHIDGSFSYHNYAGGRMAYDGGYGSVNVDTVGKLLGCFRNVPGKFYPAGAKIYVDYLLDGQRFRTYRGYIDPNVSGRTAYMWGGRKAPEAGVVEHYLNINHRTEELRRYIDYLKAPQPEKEETGNRMFYYTDSMVHRGENFFVSVRMGSRRTARMEGYAQWFSNDGATLHQTDGFEYENVPGGTADQTYFNTSGTTTDRNLVYRAWDLFRIPGTTGEYFSEEEYQIPPDRLKEAIQAVNAITYGGPRQAKWDEYVKQYRRGIPPETRGMLNSRNDLAGGVSDGEAGCCGFDFISRNGTLTANKAWFFSGSGYIALSNSISAPDAENPVITTLDQTHLNGGVTIGFPDGTERREKGYFECRSQPVAWVHRGKVGYLLPPGQPCRIIGQRQSYPLWRVMPNAPLHYDPFTLDATPVAKDVFTLLLEHGARPKNQTAEYQVVLNVSAAETAAYVKNNPLKIRANTPEIQAVEDLEKKLLMAIVRRSGTLAGPDWTLRLEAERPVALIARRHGAGLRLSAADLTMSPGTKISGTVQFGNAPPWTFSAELPSGIYAGSSMPVPLAPPADRPPLIVD